MPRKSKGADGFYRLNFTFEGKKYSVRSKDPKKLNAKLQAKLKELENRSCELPEEITVKQWGERWIRAYKTNVGRNSYERIDGMMRNYLFTQLGRLPLTAVKPILLQEILNDMAAEGKAADTIKHAMQIMHGLFGQAQANGLIPANPAAELALPKARPSESHRSITERERQIILETLKIFHDALTIQLLLYTGARPSEAIALTGADIHDGRVWISKAVEPRTNLIKEPKTEAGIRSIPIQKPLADVLPETGPFDYIIPQRRRNKTRDPIPTKHQTRQTLKGLWKRFLAAMDETERRMIAENRLPAVKEAVPPLRMYDLRHTYCSDLQRAGVPLNVARILMGHESVETTARIYTHTDAAQLDAAAGMLDTFYSAEADAKSDDNQGVKRA